jgi:predicted O-methyltransferase YrrM
VSLETYYYRPLRKFCEIPHLTASDIRAYATSPLNKLVSRLHMRRVRELPHYSVTAPDFLRLALGTDTTKELSFTQEVDALIEHLRPYLLRASTSDAQLVRILYLIPRISRPETVIETGVWHGVSSFALLSALEKNGCGILASIDLPPMDPKTRVEVGSAVPAQLRGRWRLTKGSARAVLPSILSELSHCDLFVHDGEHTYTNMMFEFRQIWPHLRTGGLIIVDDAHWNDSVLDFRDEVDCEMWAMERTKGGYVVILRKPS